MRAPDTVYYSQGIPIDAWKTVNQAILDGKIGYLGEFSWSFGIKSLEFPFYLTGLENFKPSQLKSVQFCGIIFDSNLQIFLKLIFWTF